MPAVSLLSPFSLSFLVSLLRPDLLLTPLREKEEGRGGEGREGKGGEGKGGEDKE